MAKANVVVLHTGGRDEYQAAAACDQVGALYKLVTNAYGKQRLRWFERLIARTPRGAELLQHRSCQLIDDERVIARWDLEILAQGARRLGPSVEARLFQLVEDRLGAHAARLVAGLKDGVLLSYNYAAFAAFNRLRDCTTRKILFQCHPHPLAVRQILNDEMDRHPHLARMLQVEKELSWGEAYLRQLVLEPELATTILVASSFTKRTLIEQGISSERIKVVPYGCDGVRFAGSSEVPRRVLRETRKDPFRILFVGQFTQRKGLSYLLEACNGIDMSNTLLTLCGRGLDELKVLLGGPPPPWLRVLKSVPDSELRDQYAMADILVLPSLVEGFGLVILEAMAHGVPVITTPNTGGPDVITHGNNGFIVPCRDSNAIATTLTMLRERPELCRSLSHEARIAARQFTWQRFRDSVAASVQCPES